MYEDTLIDKVRKALGFPRPDPNENSDKLRPRYQSDYSLLSLIHSGEATIATAESPRPIIGSVGMGPCVAMAGYDSAQRIGFISHNGLGDYVEALHNLVLEELTKKSRLKLEMDIYIVGGMFMSGELARKLKDYANNNFNPKSIQEDLALSVSGGRYLYLGKTFFLDTRNGKVHSIDGGGELQHVPPAEPRISLRKSSF